MTTAGCCCFCGGGKLSREHIWPQWAADLLPQSPGHVQFTDRQRPGVKPVRVKENDRQGSITTTRLRVVCRTCNNGWMAGLEEAARVPLSALMTAQAVSFTGDTRRVVRQWITMKLMVLDKASRPDAVFLPTETAAFFADRTIPSNLAIWLSQCGRGRWATAYRAHTRSASNTPTRPQHLPNMKAFTWGVGALLVVAYYQRDVVMGFSISSESAFRLWPDDGVIPTWPRSKSLTEDEAEEVAKGLDGLDDDPGVRWAP